MALLLADYMEKSQDEMEKGIIEELINQTPILRALEFDEVEGNAYAYLREDVDNMGSVDFYNLHEKIVDSEAKTTPHSAALTSLIGDAKVANLAKKSMSNIHNQMAEQISAKTKLIGEKFEYQAVYGSTSNKGFDGLHVFAAEGGTTQKLTMAANTTGAALTAYALDEAIDNCRASGEKIIVTTRRVRRNMNRYLRGQGSSLVTREKYGYVWPCWGDEEIPIVVCDKMLDTELCDSDGQYASVGTGATSSLFVVTLGENGLLGLQSGGIDTSEQWDKLEDEDSSKVRIKWYVSLCLKSSKGLVRICNITNATMAA
jgi:hypothetical protein